MAGLQVRYHDLVRFCFSFLSSRTSSVCSNFLCESRSECAYVNILDHCVQLVGYNQTDPRNSYWIVRNSCMIPLTTTLVFEFLVFEFMLLSPSKQVSDCFATGSTAWGIEGYIWLEMGHDTCGIAHEVNNKKTAPPSP
jgi:hypothetical protein